MLNIKYKRPSGAYPLRDFFLQNLQGIYPIPIPFPWTYSRSHSRSNAVDRNIMNVLAINVELERGLMPIVMAALPNVGGALCSTRKVWLTPTSTWRAITLPRRDTS